MCYEKQSNSRGNRRWNVRATGWAFVVPTVTTFENGTEGWSVSGRNDIGPDSGNPGALLTCRSSRFSPPISVMMTTIRTSSATTPLGPFRLSVDIKIDSITFFGREVERTLIVELRDSTTPNPNGYPYTSVYYELGTISASQPGWRTFSVDVTDPTSATIPPGWRNRR